MAHRWSKPTKRKQRIDPRYFLEETATRGEEVLDEGVFDAIGTGLTKMGAFGKEAKLSQWWRKHGINHAEARLDSSGYGKRLSDYERKSVLRRAREIFLKSPHSKPAQSHAESAAGDALRELTKRKEADEERGDEMEASRAADSKARDEERWARRDAEAAAAKAPRTRRARHPEKTLNCDDVAKEDRSMCKGSAHAFARAQQHASDQLQNNAMDQEEAEAYIARAKERFRNSMKDYEPLVSENKTTHDQLKEIVLEVMSELRKESN